MSALHLQYDVEADRLLARLQPAPHGELVQVQRDKLVLCIDRAQKVVSSFVVVDLRHFVSYHLLDEIFGDQVVREIAAFQSAVTATSHRSQEVELPALPRSSRRTVEELLRAA